MVHNTHIHWVSGLRALPAISFEVMLPSACSFIVDGLLSYV
jgi:hypothetical protein